MEHEKSIPSWRKAVACEVHIGFISKTLIFGVGAVLLIVLLLTSASASQLLKAGEPESVGMDPRVLCEIDSVVEEQIRQDRIPGCVVLVARRGRIVWEKAYGRRSLRPTETPNSLSTIYDFASLTKPVATATAVALLVDDGKLSVNEKVVDYLPAFAQNGKSGVTISHLLTHTSGLKAYPDMAHVKKKYGPGPNRDAVIEHICSLKKSYETGKFYVYSCLNFVILARIVETVAGEPMHQLLKRRVWRQLGMNDTAFFLTPDQRRRAAPTVPDGSWDFTGKVHDPLARFYTTPKHACGNAGLFSTAHNLAIFAQMVLNRGEYAGTRILKPETVDLFTAPQTPPDLPKRGFGWDVDSPYAHLPRGDVIPAGSSFGHTGFTGTSLWIDKKSQTLTIILSNRTHMEKGAVAQLRRRVATVVGRSIDMYAEKPREEEPIEGNGRSSPIAPVRSPSQ